MSTRKIATIAVVCGVLAVASSVTAIALVSNDNQSCGPHAVAEARVQHGKQGLTVVNPPPGSVAAGGGDRIEVNGHRVHLDGRGHLYVRCQK